MRFVSGVIWIVLCAGCLSFMLLSSKPFVEKKYKDADVDVLGNVLLSDGINLDKYDENGKLLSHYSQTIYGEISELEANDALNVLVYYNDFQKVQWLDSDLSPKADAIDIVSLGYQDVSTVCSSFNNGMWIWDEQNSELIRIDNAMQIDQRSGNLYTLTGESIVPVKMREGNQYLIVLDKEKGFFFFDRFGAYLKHLPYSNIVDFDFIDHNLVFLGNDSLYTLNTHTQHLAAEATHCSDAKAFSLRGKRLLWIDGNNKVYIQNRSASATNRQP